MHRIQSELESAPGLGEYEPGKHSTQVLESDAASAVENFPSIHCLQTFAVAAKLVEYVPATHIIHTVALV
jgi:hypothetical protein